MKNLNEMIQESITKARRTTVGIFGSPNTLGCKVLEDALSSFLNTTKSKYKLNTESGMKKLGNDFLKYLKSKNFGGVQTHKLVSMFENNSNIFMKNLIEALQEGKLIGWNISALSIEQENTSVIKAEAEAFLQDNDIDWEFYTFGNAVDGDLDDYWVIYHREDPFEPETTLLFKKPAYQNSRQRTQLEHIYRYIWCTEVNASYYKGNTCSLKTYNTKDMNAAEIEMLK